MNEREIDEFTLILNDLGYAVDDILHPIDEKNHTVRINDEEDTQRTKYILEALVQGYTLTRVIGDLKEKGFRRLYVRNPIEFILYCVFKYNEINNRKYSLREFKSLCELCTSNIEISGPVFNYRKDETKEIVTLGSLKDYLNNNEDKEIASSNSQGAKMVGQGTNLLTQMIIARIQSIDVTRDFEKQVKIIFDETVSNMAYGNQKIRWYFIKYLSYVLISQIYQFKQILIGYSETDAISYCRTHKFDEKGFYNVFRLDREDLYKEDPAKQDNCNDEPDGDNRTENEKQAGKKLLQALSRGFILTGKSHEKELDSCSIFHGGIGNLINKTPIFGGGMNKGRGDTEQKDDIVNQENTENTSSQEKKRKARNGIANHIKYSDEIRTLIPDDFYDFKVDLNKLYSMLFESLLFLYEDNDGESFSEMQQKKENDRRVEFIKDILEGKYNLTYSDMMFFLLSVKMALFNAKELIEEEWLPSDAMLNLSRVEKILENCGYETRFNYGEFDDEYQKLFNTISTENIEEFICAVVSADSDSDIGNIAIEYLFKMKPKSSKLSAIKLSNKIVRGKL